MRTWVVGMGAAAALVIGFAAGSASLSGVTVNAPPGAAQAALTGATVTNSLRDRFTVTSAVVLSGQISDFNGGAGFTSNSGPTWAADNSWSNSASDFVTRATGSGLSTARVPWLTRRSTVGVTLTSYATTVNAGVLTGANASGTSAVAAVLDYSGGTYRFGIYRIDGTTATACSLPLALTGTTARTINLTYTPSAGGTASATITGGSSAITSTCDLSTVNGAHAGLYSNSATTTRYDSFSAVL